MKWSNRHNERRYEKGVWNTRYWFILCNLQYLLHEWDLTGNKLLTFFVRYSKHKVRERPLWAANEEMNINIVLCSNQECHQYTFLFFFSTAFAQKCKLIYERYPKSHASYITFAVPSHKDSHNTGNFMPYPVRIVCGFFNDPHWTYKHGRYLWDLTLTVYSPYPRRLESLTICWCNYKGSTFYSVILRPWLLPGRSRTHDLPHDSLILHQLSHQYVVIHHRLLSAV